MSSVTLFRLATVVVAMTAAGCGSTAAPTAVAPRPLQLPAEIRPIRPESSRSDYPADDTRSAPAQFEQPQSEQPQAPGRITRLNAAASGSDSGTIREPAAAAIEVAAVPSRPPRRSEFVPIAMPEPTAPPVHSPTPELPAQPTFTTATTSDGPNLVDPTGLPAAPTLPIAPSPPQIPIASQYSPPAVHNSPPQHDAAAMQVVSQRAMQIADRASALAERGMLFSARTELLKALQLIAQALDAQEASTEHSAALAAGLTALEEACEFSHAATRPGEATDVAVIAASHRTPLLQTFDAMSNSPIVAQQQYFGQAQAQLTLAVGGVPAGSQILYRLGRLQTALAIHDADPLALHGPRSLVYHQAALATDSGNWLAANELGVLFARYGQLPEARQLLVHSVTVYPHLEGWHNLSVVHRRLGEADLASRAENEWKLLAQQTGKTRSQSNQMVQWVDTKTFASAGGGDVHWPATVAAKPAASSVSPVRR